MDVNAPSELQKFVPSYKKRLPRKNSGGKETFRITEANPKVNKERRRG
jgi:hypothetical protein